MRSGTNWLSIALAAEQAPAPAQAQAQAQAPGQVPGQAPQQGEQPEGQAPISPAPTPTTEQQANAGKQQRAEFSKIMSVSVPEAARKVLPYLNQTLQSLESELLSMDDLRLTDRTARSMAIEIMTEWIAASNKGPVSDLASIVASSRRIAYILENAQ